MKKYLPLLLLGVLSSPAIAQQEEEKAFALLDSLSQHRNFQATFTYHSQAHQGQLGEKLEGTIAVQGKQYHLTTAEQKIINNGETVWTYLAAANEVQINDCGPEQEAATPWTLLTSYRQNYVFFSLCTQQVDDQVCDVVALLAKDKKSTLLRITLTIERVTKHIKRLEVLDDNKTRHVFSFTDFVTDVALDDAFFNFSPEEYADIEVIDMR